MGKVSEFVLAPILKACAKSGSIRNLVTKIVADPKKAAMLLVFTQVAKDAFACIFYTTQSLRNKEIPKDKRKFVAALDLSNGILMTASQYTIGRLFTSDLVKNAVDKKIINKLVSSKAMQTKWHHAAGILLPLVGATILAKRVIVPLIATPVASKVKNKIFGADEVVPPPMPLAKNLDIKAPEKRQVFTNGHYQNHNKIMSIYNKVHSSKPMSV